MLGENGTGKTTFVRMLAGALKSDEEEKALAAGDEDLAAELGVPALNVSYKPQKISPKFPGTSSPPFPPTHPAVHYNRSFKPPSPPPPNPNPPTHPPKRHRARAPPRQNPGGLRAPPVHQRRDETPHDRRHHGMCPTYPPTHPFTYPPTHPPTHLPQIVSDVMKPLTIDDIMVRPTHPPTHPCTPALHPPSHPPASNPQ